MTRPRREPVPVPVPGDAPDNDAPPISPLVPGSMHRAESDAEAEATSPEFNERPRDGRHTAPPATRTPPPPDHEPDERTGE
ncbi:MAG: hypothetical protein AB7U83_01140 [Vicinamibacterales bacterium]